MAAITEDYVSFETAKLLKEKGFDEPCCGSYSYRGGNVVVRASKLSNTDLCYHPDISGISAPTLQMTMKWLRLTHKIYIQAFAPLYDMDCAELGVTYNVVITNLANQCLAFDTPLEDIRYNSPEEAYEAAIKYSLENLI